jgi:hypothetical protein
MKRAPNLKIVDIENDEELSELLDMLGEDSAEAEEEDFIPLSLEEARYEAESALGDCICTIRGLGGPPLCQPAAVIFKFRDGYQFDVTMGDGRYLVFGELDPGDIISVYLCKNDEVTYMQIE